ncbi:hypothetical protein FDC49_17990 [Clostridium sporogenes]|uniref:hypothetical protein n=1 Tax=Clostridium sporogenes TaxID=1509 RepID=UPI0013D62A68|nr:hypothetical protein [Clostridium sporogenes]NFH34349.1 hypothetical protein [Clostridium sporogenes]NFL21599.1 hypothetical protein [Clostridium sporogenes]NFN73473.1 hypothetical protein [Clostridium sporogenes]NFV23070.1 hypothetical protein [Clostridium sporogenes]
MTFNRLPLKLQKAFIDLQEYQKINSEYINSISCDDNFQEWQINKLIKLHVKTKPLRQAIRKYLAYMDQCIIILRYIFKMPIKEIMERTGYCKRSVLYHLNDSIAILNKHISISKKGKIYLRY